ncbi:hypothetical protein VNO80_19025 [Phaseolus coccineus]|uniref:Uncharacterized protein n=1 Tax=Phaseolus coccineus TaxID=3886 RepID=A0AAN9MF81_PHACN
MLVSEVRGLNEILYPRSHRKQFCIFVLALSASFTSSPSQHNATPQQFSAAELSKSDSTSLLASVNLNRFCVAS